MRTPEQKPYFSALLITIVSFIMQSSCQQWQARRIDGLRGGRYLFRTVRLVSVFLFATLPMFAQTANSCADPYWKDTLRCVFFSDEIPQPNFSIVPGQGTGDPLAKYTRVFVHNPAVRCTDGTRPLYYVDKAVCTDAEGCGNGIRRGDPIESNRWIFTVTGGDSCNGERCAFFYAQPDERGAMGSSTRDPAMDLEGIHDPDPVKNPV